VAETRTGEQVGHHLQQAHSIPEELQQQKLLPAVAAAVWQQRDSVPATRAREGESRRQQQRQRRHYSQKHRHIFIVVCLVSGGRGWLRGNKARLARLAGGGEGAVRRKSRERGAQMGANHAVEAVLEKATVVCVSTVIM
jgi:hypothetical protein